MNVLVLDRDSLPLEETVLEATVDRVDTADAARKALADATYGVVVVDLSTVDAGAILREIRTGDLADPRTPLVIAGTVPPDLRLLEYDEVLGAPGDADLHAAIERAATVAEYRETVAALYDACRDRAAGSTADPLEDAADLSRLRDRADALLAEVSRRPGVTSDLLWTPAEADGTEE